MLAEHLPANLLLGQCPPRNHPRERLLQIHKSHLRFFRAIILITLLEPALAGKYFHY
jgi:hypothetical protein